MMECPKEKIERSVIIVFLDKMTIYEVQKVIKSVLTLKNCIEIVYLPFIREFLAVDSFHQDHN